MATARQIAANQRNARRSRGPKTAQGKARMAQNALTHGLLSGETLLPGEDWEVLRKLTEPLRTHWALRGPQEELTLDLMIRAVWRLRRLGRMETGIFACVQLGLLAQRAEEEAAPYRQHALSGVVADLNHVRIDDTDEHQRAIAEAEQMRARRYEGTAMPGRSFIRDARNQNAFAKLSRHEAAIERSYVRALHELQRLQFARGGGHVPPPMVSDVTVDGVSGGTEEPAER